MSLIRFEKVHTVRQIYDGIRSGTAELESTPHYFASVFDEVIDEVIDDYTDCFRLYPVTAEFMERELSHWRIFRAWEAKFHHGLARLETHPGHGGVDAQYDELGRWLNHHIQMLDPLPLLFTATFRTLPGQEDLPAGILRDHEVAWAAASTEGGKQMCG